MAAKSSAPWPLLASTAAAATVFGGLAVEALHRYRRRQELARPEAAHPAPEPLDAGIPAAQPAERAAADGGSADERAAETQPVPAEPAAAPQPPEAAYERPMGLRTLLAALQASDRVSPESIGGPFQMSAGDEVPVVCFQFRMSHFTCKAYLAHGTQDEGGSQHLKLQTVFDDNRRSLGEEQRYFVANEWNATKRYTRLKCGSGGNGRSSSFTLEYDVLCPSEMPHSWGLLLLSQTLRMWYTSMVACVMHIVEPREVPFATHEMITSNTLAMTIREEDAGLLRESCPICFETFRVGERVRRLPCMHLFHVVGEESESEQGRHCNIDKHLVRDKQCPVCKTPIDIMERADLNPAKGSKGPTGGVEAVGSDVVLGVDSQTGTTGAEGPEAPAETARLPATTAVTALASAAQAVAVAAAAADQAASIASSNGGVMAAVTGVAEVGENMEGQAEGERTQQAGVADAAGEAAGDARNMSAAGLPAQAIELERAVRSLQSRWLQIQDVVAGMQQMLQYIEGSQTALNLARQAQDGDGIQNAANTANAAAATAAATAAAAIHAASAAADAVASVTPPPPALAAIAPAADTPQRNDARETEQARAAEVRQPSADERTAPRPSEEEDEGVLQGSTAASTSSRAQAAPAAEPASAQPQEPAQEELQGLAAPVVRLQQRWLPFTESEKVCMAYIWRQRRAAMMRSAPEQ